MSVGLPQRGSVAARRVRYGSIPGEKIPMRESSPTPAAAPPRPSPEAAPEPRIAVLVPCYNEELTVAEVVRQFREALPAAEIYVFDNNSSDRTAERARQAGAHVFFERRRGKGYVVQSMFRRVDADIYLMVDGDSTYPAAEAGALIEPVRRGDADMVIGTRLDESKESEFHALNRFGNRFFRFVFAALFKVEITDLLSGYRAFSRRLVRSLPLFGGGFEIEAELTIKALQRGFPIVEVPVRLVHRPEGSRSKIRIVQDGFIILNAMLTLFRDYKPLTVFGGFGAILLAASVVPAVMAAAGPGPLGLDALPSAILAASLGLVGLVSISVGLILHAVARRFQELESRLQLLTEEPRSDSPEPRSSSRT
jgi:GT2 family glycosyltransferase